MAEVFIGTSGWSYPSWRGPFFPKSVPSKDHLGFYASEFNTTELNGVFYRTPTLQAVRDVYVYFDNDQKAAAPADARRLVKMAGK
jgi:uncharacterized protein YecE (DUF72 family)